MEPTPEPSQSASVAVQEKPNKTDRVALWNTLTPADKRMIGIFTLEDFLKADNITGFGPNSVFTHEGNRG